MFKGQFKFNNASGVPFTYANGDVVVHQGKLYKSTRTTQQSPMQSPNDWMYLNLTQIYRGTNAPINPKENQIWISDDGIEYVYFYDGNSYQWIGI
jgi:hypothetical protein